MVAFTTLFNTILLAVLYASYAAAAPWPNHVKHPTHRTRSIGRRGLKVETYHPKTTFQTFGAGLEDSSINLVGRADDKAALKKTATSWLTSQLGTSSDNVAWKSGYTWQGCSYAYMKQSFNNITVANAVANIAFKDNKVVSYGSSFVNATKVADATPTIDVETATTKAEEAADGTRNAIQPVLEYVVKADGSVALAHVIQVENLQEFTHREVFVDAHDGSILSVTDFVAEATYTVIPANKVTLAEGVETLKDPEDLQASPFGWHSDGTTNSTSTSGNNVVAFTNGDDTAVVQASARGDLVFDFKVDQQNDPNVGANPEAAVTNAFFLMNTLHDITYRYGFTEDAFNFQENNFDKGGRGGDHVLMSVQDPSGTNNAAFSTPPDGQSGICQMFIWTLTTPNRDGSLENDIPIHEMVHGVTNRMTGGGTGRCLQTVESGGMGEGWSDAFADWMQLKSATVKDFSLGQFVTGKEAGIRSAPYSTSTATNALTYGSIKALNEVHNIGEVWANMLHNVLAALVEAKGFDADAATNPNGNGGNTIFMHLFMDALALQPCNPTFVDARNAWIQADQNRFNGANACTVFTAFASRGLGVNAGPDFDDDFTIPPNCEGAGGQANAGGRLSAGRRRRGRGRFGRN